VVTWVRMVRPEDVVNVILVPKVVSPEVRSPLTDCHVIDILRANLSDSNPPGRRILLPGRSAALEVDVEDSPGPSELVRGTLGGIELFLSGQSSQNSMDNTIQERVRSAMCIVAGAVCACEDPLSRLLLRSMLSALRAHVVKNLPRVSGSDFDVRPAASLLVVVDDIGECYHR
jgi:hypothetical protein